MMSRCVAGTPTRLVAVLLCALSLLASRAAAQDIEPPVADEAAPPPTVEQTPDAAPPDTDEAPPPSPVDEAPDTTPAVIENAPQVPPPDAEGIPETTPPAADEPAASPAVEDAPQAAPSVPVETAPGTPDDETLPQADAPGAEANPPMPPGGDDAAAGADDEEAPVADEEGVLPGEPDDEPGIGLPADAATPVSDTPPAGEAPASGETPGAAVAPEAVRAPPRPDVQETIYLLGTEVPPGAIDWLSWSASESFEGISTPTPILIVNGRRPGPTLCLTAALHGDELNGVEMVRRIMYSLDPEALSGAVIGAPIVNLSGFRRSSRYLPDRRDLNRYFPGSPTGSSAARIAHSFFHEIIVHCDALVDVHTGSFHRANLPQLRADLNIPEVVELTRGFGATVVLHSRGSRGTLRRAATDRGIPAVTLEAGEPMRLQPKEVAHGVKGIETLLDKLGMVRKPSFWGDPQPVYYEARWIRANTGGILFSNVNLGERVRKDEVLGTVTDPITNKRSEIRSPWNGRVIGRALNQVVMPGFAAFHVGIQTSEKEILESPEELAGTDGSAEEPEDGEAAARGDEAEAEGAEARVEAQGYVEEDERPE